MAGLSARHRRRGAVGALWALIPAWLQAKRGSHIVITTIMFNFIAASVMVYLLVDVLKPAGSMAPQTRTFAEGAQLPKLGWFLAEFGFTVRPSRRSTSPSCWRSSWPSSSGC